MRSDQEQEFLQAEQKVELRSSDLKKELRLRDLVAIQILNVVGLSWIGSAAKLGSSHAVFWLAAVLFFYIPSGLVVAHLATEMPLEGGLYQWAKLRFGALAGFLVAMNIWLNNVFIVSKVGIASADSLSYALGANGAWLAGSKLAITAVTTAIIGGLIVVAWRGLSLGKWINAIGGAGVLILFGSIILISVPRWFSGNVTAMPAALSIPAFTVFNLNVLGKMGMGALSGMDGAAIFAGECRDRNVAKAIRMSVWIAGPVISAIFILGTASVLTFVKPADVDLVVPITQVLSLGAPSLKAIAALLVVVTLVTGNSLSFSTITRLPMVAGWDHLLPEWFSRLHPRHRTPTGSILVVAAIAFVFGMLANLTGGNQEAFQLLDNAGGIFYALAYLTMFAIPLLASGEKPKLSVRIAAASGFLMALLYVTLSVIPIVDVANSLSFTLKIVAVVAGFQVLGALYFAYAQRRRNAALPDGPD